MGVVSFICGGLHSPFYKFVKRGIDWFHDNISNILHNHSFSNIIFNMHCVHLRSYTNTGWVHGFFAHLLISFFPLGLKRFPFYIMHQVEPPPSFSFQVDLLHLWPTFKSSGDSNFCCSHGGEHIASHDIVWNPLQLHHDKHEVTCFMWTNSCPLPPSLQSSCQQVDTALYFKNVIRENFGSLIMHLYLLCDITQCMMLMLFPSSSKG
jgi:hypothetical protein